MQWKRNKMGKAMGEDSNKHTKKTLSVIIQLASCFKHLVIKLKEFVELK